MAYTIAMKRSSAFAQQLLADLIAIESVSADPSKRAACVQAAQLLQATLIELGFTVEILQRPKAHPLVFAHRIVSPTALTIGIYGHYDVQPADPVDQWHAPPFQLTAVKKRLVGRGVADNKGHIVQNIAALKRLIDQDQLRNNIVFIIEGEEEVGGPNLAHYLEELHMPLTSVDIWLVTDVGMANPNQVKLYYGLRGLMYYQLTVSVAERDLHSGVYGNAVHNPVQVIAHLLSAMQSTSGKITIPGFSKTVRKIPKKELAALEALPHSDSAQGQTDVWGERSLNPTYPHLSAKVYPSLDVNGIQAGYNGPGSKTIIPHTASVKFSFRLVEHQDPKELHPLVETFIAQHIPNQARYTLEKLSAEPPFYTSLDHPLVNQVEQLFTEYYHNPVLHARSGGSIPVATHLEQAFGKPVLPTGCLKDFNIHAPNEYIEADVFENGISALAHLYGKLKK